MTPQQEKAKGLLHIDMNDAQELVGKQVAYHFYFRPWTSVKIHKATIVECSKNRVKVVHHDQFGDVEKWVSPTSLFLLESRLG